MDNWILKQAYLVPNRIAVDDGKTQLTFAKLKQEVIKLSGQLKTADVLEGQRVAIMTSNSLSGYLLALAILGSNRSIVWINWRLSDEEITRQLKDSNPSMCLVEDKLWRDSFQKGFMKFSSLMRVPAANYQLVSEFHDEDVASIMYTSGTTGRPKGVMQTFGNHFASAVSSSLNLGLSAEDEWLCAVPIFHISGFSIMMRGLIYGMTIRLVSHFQPENIDQILTTEPISTVSVVPYMLKKVD